MELRCPICKSSQFVAFNGRSCARCAGCQAMERTRLLWLILEKHSLFRPGLRVMHVAPELPLAKRYSELLDDRYFACDVNAARYTSTYTVIRPLDLCADLVKLPSRCFDLIIHSHVLEHIRCDPERVLGEFERIVQPGGHHFLSVPVSGEETREDMSDDLSDAERSQLFGQADHLRIFGRRSLLEMLDRVWGSAERHHIEPAGLFEAQELERAAIPREAWSGISSHSIFHHVRSRTRAVRVTSGEAVTAAPHAQTAVARPKLILHIGMPKAATTSLQHAFVATPEAAPDLDYWQVAENHSEAMFMAFADPARIARGEMWFQQDSVSGIDRSAALESFNAFLDGLGARTGFVSAETLWTFPARDVATLAAHLKDRCIDTLVLCWIRPPAEFMTSAVQQRVRTQLTIGAFALEFQKTVPIHYHRMDAWLENFGADRVRILPLTGNVVHEARALLAELGIAVEQQPRGERALNPSISLLAAKALLALNEGRGERISPQLRAKLQKLKGAEFCLPESIIRRTAPLFRKEARYLSEHFGIGQDWLLPDATGLDDALFFHWEYYEVAALLGALNEMLLKEEVVSARAIATSGEHSGSRSRGPSRKP